MDQPRREQLFLEVRRVVGQKGIPVSFPKSLYHFIDYEDVVQEFYLGVSKRLLKVKTFKEGTGTSPEVGYLIDGGVKAVQDMIRQICVRNLMPRCACGVWVKKSDKICPKCKSEISYSEICVNIEHAVGNEAPNRPDRIVDSKLMIEKFGETLVNKGRIYQLFQILTGRDKGACHICTLPCKGAIQNFEFIKNKWESGCINMCSKVAAYWKTSPTRVSQAFKKLRSLAQKFANKND